MDSRLVRQNGLVLILLMTLLTSSWSAMITSNDSKFTIDESMKFISHSNNDFNSSNGFLHENTSVINTTGEAKLTRPAIQWGPTNANGLMFLRTGACTQYLEETNEIWLMGGRIDPNPMTNSDEGPTSAVEIFDVTAGTWGFSNSMLNTTQQYAGCAQINGKIYLAGDYHPTANPEIRSQGLLQSFDLNTSNWTMKTSMPSGKGVGLAGVDALDGYLYVAGGVNRQNRNDLTDNLLRYDPTIDNWTQLSSMNYKRHSFTLTAFHGKLYAIGGVSQEIDPVTSLLTIVDSNRTEVYDPATDTWTNLSDLPISLAAHTATVFNDEIILFGGYEDQTWNGLASKNMYGYHPLDQTWRLLYTSPIGRYDSTIASAGGTIMYATGDSSGTRFSSWNANYVAETEYFENPNEHEGWITSLPVDLRYSSQGTATPMWMTLDGNAPYGTDLQLQYKSGSDAVSAGLNAWQPVGTNASIPQFVGIGNHSLSNLSEDTSFMQYRIKYTTIAMQNWSTPELDNVELISENVAITSSIPNTMHPNAAPVTITTHHHAYSDSAQYQLSIVSANSQGFKETASQWTTLTWSKDSNSFTVNDPDSMLMPSQTSVQEGLNNQDGQLMNWQFSLSEGLATDYILMQVKTVGLRNTTYTHPTPIIIDKEVDVRIKSISANFTSQGNYTLQENEIVPELTKLNLIVDNYFTTSGNQLLSGTIQARIHLDIIEYNQTEEGNDIWANATTGWFSLNIGQETDIEYTLPENISGQSSIWIEATTMDNLILNVDETPHMFILNIEVPVMLSTTITDGEYINKDANRLYGIQIYNVGGFTNNTTQMSVWVEDRDDGYNGNPLDGIAQIGEYQQQNFSIVDINNIWYLNLTVNDSGNADHQIVRTMLTGVDVSNHSLPMVSAEDGTSWWISRDPQKALITDITPLGEIIPNIGQRLEPTRQIGWSITASDSNEMEDLSEFRIELGGDSNLGIKYLPHQGICSSLDARLLVDSSKCIVTMSNGEMTVEMWATVDWTLTGAGLIAGEVDVIVRDYDGATRQSQVNQWSLERALDVQFQSLMDVTGPVNGTLGDNPTVMAGDQIEIEASVKHLISDKNYNGQLGVIWSGKIQNKNWQGGMTADVVDGQLSLSFPTPIESGLIHDAKISIWDPLDSEKLLEIALPDLVVDADAPMILQSQLTSGISRYHLNNVEIGVNIDEPQSWSSSLSLTCQVKSTEQDWQPVTLSRESSTIFDGKTMFAFNFDFSSLGDPSLLSNQARIVCWADGYDDAGWQLDSENGNSQLSPWLESTLNNIGPDLELGEVKITGDTSPGSKLSLKIQLINGGEKIQQPFNLSVFIVQGDEKTIAARQLLYELGENTAVTMNSRITVPDGEWTLLISVDDEQLIWELDEENNIWSKDYDGTAQGFSTATILLSSSAIIALIGGLLYLKKRSSDLDELAHQSVDENSKGEPPSIDSSTKPAGGPPGKAKPSGGPPGKAKPSSGPPGKPKPKNGPPGASNSATSGSEDADPSTDQNTQPAQPEIDLQATAAAHFGALDSLIPPTTETTEVSLDQIVQPISTVVVDWNELPGGGDYEYTSDATYYSGEKCGKWLLNEDKSFTRIE
ncbi:MAG: kelch repeat-containing protein [Candidatus Poseidoniaceae archaeon]